MESSLLTGQLILILTIISLGYLTWKVVYNYKLSPISAIPNAGILAPLSRLSWAFLSEHFGRITIDLPILHRKLGPLVRIGPNELSFYSIDIYREIHARGNKYIKDPRVYGQFVQNDHPSLFSLTDPQEHSARRRLMGQLFNRSKMPLQEGLVVEQVDRLTDIVRHQKQDPVDVVAACRALEADIITLFGFGDAIGAMNAYAEGKECPMVAENDQKSMWFPVHSNFPGLVNTWYKIESLLYCTTGYRTRTTSAMEEYTEWTESHLNPPISSKSLPPKIPYPILLTTMIASGLPPRTALAEAKEQLGPGTDTTSATLSHILWGLAHDYVFQDRLYASLAAAGWPQDMSGLEMVPELKACVKEGIRWTGAATAMLPRVVPAGGVTLAGRWIAGGTVLSSSPVWYLHDEIAFPFPHSFRPMRWLEGEDEGLFTGSLMDEFYIPFSKGTYSCMGAHFSYLEIYVGVSRILKEFKLSLPLEALLANPGRLSSNATLPRRKEWVAAVSLEDMRVYFEERNSHS